MHDLRTYLSSRRTIPAPNLSQPGPDRGEIEELLTIGSRSPDHGKLAPWRFLVIEGRDGEAIGERLLAISLEANPKLDGDQQRKELTRFTRSPLVITVISTAQEHPKIPVWEQQLASGAVCMNLLHGAKALGYSAQWLTEWYSYGAAAEQMFHLAPHEKIAGFVHVGTAQIPPTERARPDIDALTTYYSQLEG
jgi:nitroreductase